MIPEKKHRSSWQDLEDVKERLERLERMEAEVRSARAEMASLRQADIRDWVGLGNPEERRNEKKTWSRVELERIVNNKINTRMEGLYIFPQF